MARIPKAELERLKREVLLERLAEARGVKLERHGADLLGLCPFHDDHEPSLVITPSKNLWHCLGACQAGGSVIDWVMRAEGVSFRHAAELLRADLPPQGLTKGPPPERSTVPKLPGLLDASEDDQVLLRRVVDYYHAALKESPEALAYLATRGLQHAEAVERFKHPDVIVWIGTLRLAPTAAEQLRGLGNRLRSEQQILISRDGRPLDVSYARLVGQMMNVGRFSSYDELAEALGGIGRFEEAREDVVEVFSAEELEAKRKRAEMLEDSEAMLREAERLREDAAAGRISEEETVRRLNELRQ